MEGTMRYVRTPIYKGIRQAHATPTHLEKSLEVKNT